MLETNVRMSAWYQKCLEYYNSVPEYRDKIDLSYFTEKTARDAIKRAGMLYEEKHFPKDPDYAVRMDRMMKVMHELALDYRIKSIQSAILKYNRYYPDHQARKVFDDLLGFRSLCDNYEDVLELAEIPGIRVADLSMGKADDDGYRGVHVYYQVDGNHYPIEIQYNTYYDRQINNWLHKYVYKKDYSDAIGLQLRRLYENAKIQTD